MRIRIRIRIRIGIGIRLWLGPQLRRWVWLRDRVGGKLSKRLGECSWPVFQFDRPTKVRLQRRRAIGSRLDYGSQRAETKANRLRPKSQGLSPWRFEIGFSADLLACQLPKCQMQLSWVDPPARLWRWALHSVHSSPTLIAKREWIAGVSGEMLKVKEGWVCLIIPRELSRSSLFI